MCEPLAHEGQSGTFYPRRTYDENVENMQNRVTITKGTKVASVPKVPKVHADRKDT